MMPQFSFTRVTNLKREIETRSVDSTAERRGVGINLLNYQSEQPGHV